MDHGNRTKIALAGVALLALGAGTYWIGFGEPETPTSPVDSTVAPGREVPDEPVVAPKPNKLIRRPGNVEREKPTTGREPRIHPQRPDDGNRGRRPKPRPRRDEKREKDIPPAG